MIDSDLIYYVWKKITKAGYMERKEMMFSFFFLIQSKWQEFIKASIVAALEKKAKEII